MRRIAVLMLLAIGATSFHAMAQQGARVPGIGYVIQALAQCKPDTRDEAFFQALSELGYVSGRNISIERRCYATIDDARKVVGELVALKVDAIFVATPDVANVAKGATREIPIVCGSCGDPVVTGLVASLARPGGNVTGLASMSAELIGKRVELLKQAVPGVSSVAALVFPNNPGMRPTLAALDAAGQALGVKIQRVEVRVAGDLEKAFKSAMEGGVQAIVVQDDPLAFSARKRIAELAHKHRLPAMGGNPQIVEAGILLAYGANRDDLFRRAASYIDKILKGAKPAGLAVEQATKFELVVNLRTANAFGLRLPQSILLRADRVIE